MLVRFHTICLENNMGLIISNSISTLLLGSIIAIGALAYREKLAATLHVYALINKCDTLCDSAICVLLFWPRAAMFNSMPLF